MKLLALMTTKNAVLPFDLMKCDQSLIRRSVICALEKADCVEWMTANLFERCLKTPAIRSRMKCFECGKLSCMTLDQGPLTENLKIGNRRLRCGGKVKGATCTWTRYAKEMGELLVAAKIFNPALENDEHFQIDFSDENASCSPMAMEISEEATQSEPSTISLTMKEFRDAIDSIKNLTDEIQQLKLENEKSRCENEMLRNEFDELSKENAELKDKLALLMSKKLSIEAGDSSAVTEQSVKRRRIEDSNTGSPITFSHSTHPVTSIVSNVMRSEFGSSSGILEIQEVSDVLKSNLSNEERSKLQHAIRRNKGMANLTSIFIEVEGVFRSERLKHVLDEQGVDMTFIVDVMMLKRSCFEVVVSATALQALSDVFIGLGFFILKNTDHLTVINPRLPDPEQIRLFKQSAYRMAKSLVYLRYVNSRSVLYNFRVDQVAGYGDKFKAEVDLCVNDILTNFRKHFPLGKSQKQKTKIDTPMEYAVKDAVSSPLVPIGKVGEASGAVYSVNDVGSFLMPTDDDKPQGVSEVAPLH